MRSRAGEPCPKCGGSMFPDENQGDFDCLACGYHIYGGDPPEPKPSNGHDHDRAGRAPLPRTIKIKASETT